MEMAETRMIGDDICSTRVLQGIKQSLACVDVMCAFRGLCREKAKCAS
jgi:hypothetical protein